MKPIELRMQGLQSYRSLQCIDFSQLTKTGLFGIFGPTGSGKSSILDAITLALYSKVERAIGGTQGIMHHAEKTLFVSFTFELLCSTGSLQFRVERRFKRVNAVSISSTFSRLVQMNKTGDCVVAEKASDVTRHIEQMIGLKMDDFTRAVVLPQGKFAQFLNLKGAERRQMLQRLFHLRKYGDELNIKLTRLIKQNDLDMAAILAEQQGLGDVGKEAWTKSIQQLDQAVQEVKSSYSVYTEAAKDADRLDRIKAWADEKSVLEKEHAMLLMQQPEICRIQQQLEQFISAQSLLPFLHMYKEAMGEYKQLKEQQAALQLQCTLAKENVRQVLDQEQQAQLALQAEQPTLQQLLLQVEEAKALVQEADLLNNEQQLLQQALDVTHEEWDCLTVHLREQTNISEHVQDAVQQMELQLKQTEVKLEERHAIQQSLDRRHTLLAQQQQLDQQNQQNQQYEQLKQKLDEMDTKLSEMQYAERQLQDEGNIVLHRLAKSIETLLSYEQNIVVNMAQVQQVQQQTQKQLLEQQQRQASKQLQSELQPGQPCTVCGSLDHPLLRQTHADDTVQVVDVTLLEHQVKKFGQLYTKLQQMMLDVRQCINKQHTMLEQLGNLPMTEAAASVALVESTAIESEGDVLSHFISCVKRWNETLQQMVPVVEQTCVQAIHLFKKMTDVQQQRMQCQAEQQLHKQNFICLHNQIEQQKKQLSDAYLQWDAHTPSMSPTEVLHKYENIQKRDIQTEQIKHKLEASKAELFHQQKTVEQIKNKQIEIEKHMMHTKTKWESKQEQLLEKRDRLYQIVGQRDVQDVWHEVHDRLSLLQKNLLDKNKQREASQLNEHELAQRLMVLSEAVCNAYRHSQQAQSRWLELLKETFFSSEEQVYAFQKIADQRKEMEHKIMHYRDREQTIAVHLRNVQSNLGDASFTKQQWQNAKQVAEQARARYEQAIVQQARTKNNVEYIETRHARYEQLEEQRQQVKKQANRLQQLQLCLRGNAFVEYMAEEQFFQVSRAASWQLRRLTNERYSLETDSEGAFVICDHMGGGHKRSIYTLSGGEIFLTSLCLALALSAQIQLRGKYPLQFFFLDEGFGTLDSEKLDVVITMLEKLRDDRLCVGLISHVAELRARIANQLIIVPDENTNIGSIIVRSG